MKTTTLLSFGLALFTASMYAQESGPMSKPGSVMLTPQAVDDLQNKAATQVRNATQSQNAVQPAGRQFWVWNILLQGTASGNSFERLGQLIVTETITTEGVTNGVNPLDIWLISGQPWSNPQVGSIIYGTNTLFHQKLGGMNAAMLDLSFVVAGSEGNTVTIQVQPDPNLFKAAQAMNSFNSSGGVVGSIYEVRQGTMMLKFSNEWEDLTGTIDFIGTGVYYYTNVSYQARITGKLAGGGTF